MKVLIAQPEQVTLSDHEQALAALAELRTVPLTPEEEEVLDQFEEFRREHPFQLSSVGEEE